jgi:hypothetical protein
LPTIYNGRTKKLKNYAQQIMNTKHQKTLMKLHDAYGVHKENVSCKNEIMLIKKGKKLKNKVDCKK